MRPITPQPGNDRDPENFVGRVATTARARERLKAGANLLLTAPRRMGKTFWMLSFAAREAGFRPYFIDYEGTNTVEEFLSKTVNALLESSDLPTKTRKVLKTVFKNIKSVGVPGILTIQPYHRATSPHKLLQEILITLDDQEGLIPLILMDEVPMAIEAIGKNEGQEAARALLQTLRAIRQANPNISWIVAGSIGFHHVLTLVDATSGELYDLEPLRLELMPSEESQELASRLLLGINIQPEAAVVAELIAVGGGMPAIQHMVVSSLKQRLSAGTALGPQEVRECFEDSIDSQDEFRWLMDIDKRISFYYGQRTELAERVLCTALSSEHRWLKITDLSQEAELPQQQELTKIINILCDDHYLEIRGKSVRWRYPVFQYIWARKNMIWERP